MLTAVIILPAWWLVDKQTTTAERRSRLYLALAIKNKTAAEANKAILKLLKPIKDWVNTNP